jgi:hypothetical protein
MPNVKKKSKRIEAEGRIDVSLHNSKSCQPKRMYGSLTNTTTAHTDARKKKKENDSVNSEIKKEAPYVMIGSILTTDL